MKKEINLEEIFLEEIDELIASNFSDCSSFVEVIDGFGVYKNKDDKTIFIKNCILAAMKETAKQALELAAENADVKEFFDHQGQWVGDFIDKDSILDTINQVK